MPNGAGERNLSRGGFTKTTRSLQSREDDTLDITGLSDDFGPEEPTVYLGNIPFHFSEVDVTELLERVVPVVAVHLKSGTRPNYKYAFVYLECLEDCFTVIDEFNDHPVFKLKVRFPNHPRPHAQKGQAASKNLCSVCGSPATLLCGRCGVIYCSPVCQKFDWPTHRQDCKSPEPLEPCPAAANQATANPPASVSANTRSLGGSEPSGTSSSRFGPQEEQNKPQFAANGGTQPRNSGNNAFGAASDQKTAVGGAKSNENRFPGGRGGANPSGPFGGRNVRDIQGGEEKWRGEESTELKPLVLPTVGKFRVTVVHVVNPQEIWVQLDKNKADLEDIANNLVKCQPNVLRNPKVGDYCLASYSDGTLNRAVIQAIRGQQAKVFYVDFGNTGVVELQSLKTLGPQLCRQGCQAAKIGLAGIVGDFSHLTTSDIDGLTDFVMNTEEDSDILLLDMELINQVIDGVPQAILSDLEGLEINDVLPDLIPALGQCQTDARQVPMDTEAREAAEYETEDEVPFLVRQESADAGFQVEVKPGADDVPPAQVEQNPTQSEEISVSKDDNQACAVGKLSVKSLSKMDDVPLGSKPGRMQSLLQNLNANVTQKQSGNTANSSKSLTVAANGPADVPPGPKSLNIDPLTRDFASIAIAQESGDKRPVSEVTTVIPPRKLDDVTPALNMAASGSVAEANNSSVAKEAETKNVVMLSSMSRVKLDRPEYSVALVSAPRIPEVAVQLLSSVIVNAMKAVQKAMMKCDSEPVLGRVPVVGEVLAAKYDGDWFRAVVDEVLLVEKEVQVTYVDYGNSARVKFQDLRELPEAAIQRPICCHIVKLSDVPEHCSTNRQVLALVTQNFDVAFEMKVVDASVDPPLVDLDNSETGKSLATAVREVVSATTKPAFRPPRMPPPGRSLRTPPVVEDKSVPTLAIPEEVEPLKLVNEEETTVEKKDADMEQSALQDGEVPANVVIETSPEVKKSETPAEIVIEEPVRRFWHTECHFSLPSEGRDLDFFVCSAEDPGQVLLTHPKDEYLLKVDELAPEIATYCETTVADPTFWPESGEIVLAYCAESQDWARALVVYEEEELDLFLVMFADFGNKEQVPLAKIRPIPERFMELPLLAATCHLKGLDDANEQVVKKVKELLPPNSLVVGNVVGCHEAYYEVEIPSLVEELQKAGLM